MKKDELDRGRNGRNEKDYSGAGGAPRSGRTAVQGNEQIVGTNQLLRVQTPLFKNLNQPSEEEVGWLISLTCGHTQKPKDVEACMITMHLDKAGFTQGRGSLGSPTR